MNRKDPRQAIVHVDQRNIRENVKTGSRKPPFTVLAGKQNIKAQGVQVFDRDGNLLCEFIYRPDKPMSCGARLWFKADLRKVKLVLDKRPYDPFNPGTDDIVISETTCTIGEGTI